MEAISRLPWFNVRNSRNKNNPYRQPCLPILMKSLPVAPIRYTLDQTGLDLSRRNPESLSEFQAQDRRKRVRSTDKPDNIARRRLLRFHFYCAWGRSVWSPTNYPLYHWQACWTTPEKIQNFLAYPSNDFIFQIVRISHGSLQLYHLFFREWSTYNTARC